MANAIRTIQFIENKLAYWTGTKWVDATGADVTTTQTE